MAAMYSIEFRIRHQCSTEASGVEKSVVDFENGRLLMNGEMSTDAARHRNRPKKESRFEFNGKSPKTIAISIVKNRACIQWKIAENDRNFNRKESRIECIQFYQLRGGCEENRLGKLHSFLSCCPVGTQLEFNEQNSGWFHVGFQLFSCFPGEIQLFSTNTDRPSVLRADFDGSRVGYLRCVSN
jgi:hypothetical protein